MGEMKPIINWHTKYMPEKEGLYLVTCENGTTRYPDVLMVKEFAGRLMWHNKHGQSIFGVNVIAWVECPVYDGEHTRTIY